MENCWLSPEGEVILCDNHDLKAWELIKERYGIDPKEISEPSHFLGRKRWMAYHNRPWWVGWWSYYYAKGPTQTQIDRIYELTGEVYKNERGYYIISSLFSIFHLHYYKFMIYVNIVLSFSHYKMKYFPKVSRGNVYLSPLNPDDYELFTKWMNDSRITDGITTGPMIFSLNGEKAWLENVAKSGDCNLAIVKKDGDKVLGTVGLFHIEHINQAAELGISIGDFEEHNKGYGTDAINAMLSFAYNTLNLYNVYLKVKSFNKKAIACYKKVGFQEIGTMHHCQYCNGEWHDMVIMEMLKPDWQEKNK